MSNRIAVICEGVTDFPVAKELIDQTLIRCPELDWVNDEAEVEQHRTYCGETEREPFFRWTAIETARPTNYRQALRGKWGDPLPKHNIEIVIQRALFRFTRAFSEAEDTDPYIVIVKDTEADETAREVLKQARTRYASERLIVGMLHTELECWLLAGFDPEDEGERDRFAAVCKGDFPPGVGFDPCVKSHDLTATKKEDEKNSPKRVLRHLTGEQQPNSGDHLTPRSRACLHRNQHAVLKARGTENGLRDFLRDIERRLILNLFGVRVAAD